jgi:nitrite reductase/ring-hydroxylating ferredoxin subunit
MVGEGWVGVLPLHELRERRSTRVLLGDDPVMLYRDAERIFAIGNRCAHQGAPLDRGPVRVSGSLATVTCQAHGSMFKLDDGAVARGPAQAPVPAYDVRVTDGIVELRPRT